MCKFEEILELKKRKIQELLHQKVAIEMAMYAFA
jgi:hypothetical protein